MEFVYLILPIASCILVVDILKICIWVLDRDSINIDRITAFNLSRLYVLLGL